MKLGRATALPEHRRAESVRVVVENAFEHWDKHSAEFPSFRTRSNMLRGRRAFLAFGLRTGPKNYVQT